MADIRSGLHPSEWEELFALLRQARFVRLEPLGERKLRELLACLDPRAAQMEWYDLVKFGKIVVGVRYLKQHHDRTAAASA